jgi:DNA-binding transcriptional LysR family regulator
MLRPNDMFQERALITRQHNRASFVSKIPFNGMDIATLRGMIAAGIGIGLLPTAPARFAGIVEVKSIATSSDSPVENRMA